MSYYNSTYMYTFEDKRTCTIICNCMSFRTHTHSLSHTHTHTSVNEKHLEAMKWKSLIDWQFR